jgi:acyl dehydratase
VAVRQPNLVGDTLWWRGEVNNEAERQGYSVVDLAIRATNQNNVVSADGTASVILPSRAKGAVRFPIPGSLAGA